MQQQPIKLPPIKVASQIIRISATSEALSS